MGKHDNFQNKTFREFYGSRKYREGYARTFDPDRCVICGETGSMIAVPLADGGLGLAHEGCWNEQVRKAGHSER